MSTLTDLEAALEAKREAGARWHTLVTTDLQQRSAETQQAWVALKRAHRIWEEAATDDTIRALLDVAEAVDKGKLTAARHSLYPLVKEER